MFGFNKVNKDRLRIVFEVFFLLVFILLFKNRVIQRWVIFFAAGLVISAFLGRFYCGWACPMALLMRPINWIYHKLKISRINIPGFMKKGWLRWILLLLFVAAMLGSRILNVRFNLILYLTFTAVLISLVFEEEFWHKWICPYGTLLSLFSKPARYGLEISDEKCISCGRCDRVCPGDSIGLFSDKRVIKNNQCLLCFKCTEVCPVDAISYRK